ncbi:hypothetical protein EV649_5209 [Kribbella sp. VKM Ac-2569]|uniref:hypothetical protein n=1 Tax=Kribbella sp. VKM Ac-2569 TaxID=2512220 RepID=UPI0010EA837E|nr:hypothetical protein [Kribbella sp. VKM Ac-2569]RZT17652.1 hypothetical protein EV649_5209 [Kribbella sp. VKM Ac-2569]
MRRFAFPAFAVVGVLLLSACSKDATDGGRPVPVGGESGTTTSSTPSTAPSSEPTTTTKPATTAKPTAPTAKQVIVQAGNFASNPAVQGLVTSYPLYFQALVTKDDTILKKQFPSFFYADVSQGIQDAKRNGWVMKPPGSVVVVGARSTPDDTVAVQTCRSQTTQYWDPKTRNWTVVTPKGSPEVIEMIKTGVGWMPYRLVTSKGVNCASVHYPA